MQVVTDKVFSGGVPQAAKNFPASQPTTVPAFWPEPVSPQIWSPKMSKFYLSIPSTLTKYFLLLVQNCIRKLYFMLKTSKFALILLKGHFYPQWTIFPSPPLIWLHPRREFPPSDSVPDRDRKLSPKASPPPKILWKNTELYKHNLEFKISYMKALLTIYLANHRALSHNLNQE